MLHYQLPLKLGKIMQQQDHPVCDLHTSIAQYIRLIVSSQYKENKYDEAFGNLLWESEFENIIKSNSTKEKVKAAIVQAIQKYESRLEHVKADIHLVEEEIQLKYSKRLREKVRIEITGIIKKNKESFRHLESFYIAPLSYY